MPSLPESSDIVSNFQDFDEALDTDDIFRTYFEYNFDTPDDLDEESLEKAFEVARGLRSGAQTDWQPRQPSSDSRVWRYLNFTQLMSVLERKSIWFSNISRFNDPYEGTIPKNNINQEITKIVEESDVSREVAKDVHQELTSGYSYNATGYVSCWNKNDHESAALWEQYIDSSEGVAISTTVDNLESALSSSDNDLTLGEVKYINYETETIPDGVLPTFYHKRLSFEHENEYRISFVDESGETKMGHYLDVDVDSLIDELYLAPTSQDWFADQVKEVLDTYEVDCTLKKSDIDSDPVY